MGHYDYSKVMRALYKQAPDRIRMRAKGYFSEDRIKSLNITGDGVLKARVQGTAPEPYYIEIDLKNRTRKCSCPAHHNYRNIPCKHQVLVVLPFIGTDAGRK